MKNINFSNHIYDLVGYLFPSTFCAALIIIEFDFIDLMDVIQNKNLNPDFIFNREVLTKATEISWTKGTVILFGLIIAFYILGHIIAAFSSLVLERILLKRFTFLNLPVENLFNTNIPTNKILLWIRKNIFTSYCKKFDDKFIAEFKEKMEKRFYDDIAISDYYWMCYADILNIFPASFKRLQHFVNLYGFNRNSSAAIIFYVIFIRLIVLRLYLGVVYTTWGVVFSLMLAATSILLYWSYLKLFKRQAVDMFYVYFAALKKNDLGYNLPDFNYSSMS